MVFGCLFLFFLFRFVYILLSTFIYFQCFEAVNASGKRSTMDPATEKRILQVTDKFNAFVSRQKSEVVSAKEQYVRSVSQVQTEHRELARQLAESHKKERELQQQLEREAGDANESQSRIADLRIREKQLAEERLVLEKQVAELQTTVQQRREELSGLRQDKQRQGELDLPEAMTYEQLLGFRIEGLKDDVLRLVFHNIDAQDPKRQYSLLLNVSQHMYAIDGMDPELPSRDAAELLAQFNDSRDLSAFLKSIRQAFKRL